MPDIFDDEFYNYEDSYEAEKAAEEAQVHGFDKYGNPVYKTPATYKIPPRAHPLDPSRLEGLSIPDVIRILEEQRLSLLIHEKELHQYKERVDTLGNDFWRQVDIAAGDRLRLHEQKIRADLEDKLNKEFQDKLVGLLARHFTDSMAEFSKTVSVVVNETVTEILRESNTRKKPDARRPD